MLSTAASAGRGWGAAGAVLLADPLNLYITITAVGIVWVLGLARMFYFNPLTNHKTVRAICLGLFARRPER